jgi:hypothetical protein
VKELSVADVRTEGGRLGWEEMWELVSRG